VLSQAVASRHAGFSVGLTTEAPPRVYTLFPEGVFDLQRVVRPTAPDLLAEMSNSEVSRIVHDLHQRMNNGEDTQVEIDRYLLYVYLEASACPLLKALPWQSFVVCAEHVPGMKQMPDIGKEIRDMLMFMPTQNCIHRVLQYSMPYIKHNRLNFPLYEDITANDLTKMIRVVMACCLGVLRAHTKRPVFVLRVKLYAFFHELLARGSSADHYVFCTANLCLLRVAMIEYFIIFMHKFMPAEKEVLCQRFELNNTTDALFNSFCLIFDVFRQTAMQVPHLDFVNINLRAHIAIEKCNRVTKGKNRPSNSSACCKPVFATDALLKVAIHSHRFAHASYAMLQPLLRNLAWKDILQIQTIHNIVAISSLPANILRMQTRHLAKISIVNSNCLTQSTMLFVCLRCACATNKFVLNKKMRIVSDGRCFCSECDNDTYVLRVCTLGRIVKVREQYFFFCCFCCSTHEWPANGHEFSSCSRTPRKDDKLPISKCCLCTRNTSLSPWEVLDDVLGVQRDLMLCPKHRPLAHQQSSVYNIQTLRLAVLHKLNRYRTSALEITNL